MLQANDGKTDVRHAMDNRHAMRISWRDGVLTVQPMASQSSGSSACQEFRRMETR